MAKYLHIEIPSACHENWDDMQDSGCGRYCGSCKKTVIDFSVMSDEQLIKFFSTKRENVCGRFYGDQLNRKIPMPVKKISWATYFFKVMIPAMLMSFRAEAQQQLKKISPPWELLEKKQQPGKFRSTLTVIGYVKDIEGNPIPYANVISENTGNGVSADSSGYFSMQVTQNDSLQVSAIGYEKKQITSIAPMLDIQLKMATMDNVVVMSDGRNRGITTFAGGITSSITIERWWNKPKLLSDSSSLPKIKLFPNPVRRNSAITISWDKPVNNDQELIIFNSAGIKLMQKTLYVNHSLYQEQLNLKLTAAGHYTMQVIDRKTKSKQSVSFIVE